MKNLFWLFAYVVITLALIFALNPAHAAGGAGGSWGNDSGFGGNGGSFGGSGGSGGWIPDENCWKVGGGSSAPLQPTAEAACRAYAGSNADCGSLTIRNDVYAYHSVYGQVAQMICEEEPKPPECPADYHLEGGVCVKDLKCPAGYAIQGNTCVWQCPAGYKLLGGNCVKDDMPEDCDPTIQECDENGEPVCDCCDALHQLVNQNNTIINNDNRIISLTENITSNQNTIINNTENINNNISNVNNNISTVNNNLTTINESIQNIINAIEENNPEFDTSGIESKLQQLIDKKITIDGANIELDFAPLISKLNEIENAILNSAYDDTELKAKIDELINKDLSEITDRQDEQTSLLEDIKRLLMPTNEAGDPALDLPEVETNDVDLWGAIKGFDINQNIINATAECPPDKEFTINLGIKTATFAIPMSPMCQYLSYLAPIFLMLAYFSGAMIILKAGD